MLADVVAIAANPPPAQSKTPSEVPKAWGCYLGDRIGIFAWNNAAEAGHVGCDSFTCH